MSIAPLEAYGWNSIDGGDATTADTFGIDPSNSDFNWLLHQMPLLPSTSDVQQIPSYHQLEAAAPFASDSMGWYDVGAGIERRYSQSSSLWDGSTRSASGSKSRGVKRRRMGKTAAPIKAAPPSSSNLSTTFESRQRALQQISASRWNADCLAEVDHFTCEDRHCFAMEPMGQDPRGYLGGEKQKPKSTEVPR